jgi:phosphoglycerate dehydrogenase-like enzyme
MPRVRVFCTDGLPPEAREVLSSFDVFEKEATDDSLAGCQALITWPSRAKRELLMKMHDLKMVQSLAAGVDGLAFDAIPPGAAVFSNAGAFTGPVAEHAWGLLLGLAKGLHVRKAKVVPRRLEGKTLLVIGGGAIGSEVARLSKSLAMKTVGVSRSFSDPGAFDERYRMSDLGQAMSLADAVAIALPLTRETRGVVDYGVLSKGREGVMVVNVGRGDTVSEEGLARWLKERPESRYATDVFWVKDGKESFETELWDLPNFAGTLHNSGVPLGESLVGPKLAAAQNVRTFFESGRARNRVDVSEYMTGA